ncbi:MAG: hypothetical protein NVS3B20_21800 [Polyangiales bacterium]
MKNYFVAPMIALSSLFPVACTFSSAPPPMGLESDTTTSTNPPPYSPTTPPAKPSAVPESTDPSAEPGAEGRLVASTLDTGGPANSNVSKPPPPSLADMAHGPR